MVVLLVDSVVDRVVVEGCVNSVGMVLCRWFRVVWVEVGSRFGVFEWMFCSLLCSLMMVWFIFSVVNI